MILGSAFLDVAVIRHDRTILRDQCVFPNDQNKDIKNSVSFVLSASVAADKSKSFVVVYKIKLWFILLSTTSCSSRIIVFALFL